MHQDAHLTLHATLLLVDDPTNPCPEDDACTLLMAALDAAAGSVVSLPADALHRLLKGMSDALATANWRASTLYEAGWRHLSEAATEVQP